MYTGKTEKPCCLCDDREIETRIDLPPRAIQQLQYGDRIAWQDVVGIVSIYFCANDWETVSELVLELGLSPLPRCNVARASFDLREDFEALVNQRKDEQDHQALEERLWAESERVLDGETEYPADDRELVEAHVVRWVLDDLDAPVASEGVYSNG